MAGGFESLGLMPEILRAVDDIGWMLPTDVQDEAIPLILGGGDVMAAAETGSGKTAAFCLPIIQCVYERLRSRNESAERKGPLKAPVITLNASDKDALLNVSADGLRCNSTAEKMWLGVRATHGVRSGRYYFECSIVADGICRVGWATMAGHHELGRDGFGFGYGGTAMKSHNNNFEPYGEKYGKGDVISCLLDYENGLILFAKNGLSFGKAFNIPESLKGATFLPAVVMKGSDIELNFGAAPFRFPMEKLGFTALATADPNHVVGSSSAQASQIVGKRTPLAIIIEPSRDLAEQVYQALNDMARYIESPRLKSILLVGGDDSKRQQRELHEGVDVVVGTTGKIVDMLQSKVLNLNQVKFFVLDEADRLIETDNLASIMEIFKACPTGGIGEDRLQVCFFSATLHSPAITELASKICINPSWVDLKGVDSVPETVHHVVYRVNPVKDAWLLTNAKTLSITDDVHPKNAKKDNNESRSQMVKELKQQALLQIIDKYKMSQCMIFCRTNVDCDNLETFLTTHGGGRKFTEKVDSGKENAYSCCVLAGMRSMAERRKSLDAFKEGYVRFLICTDVAARGIDIVGLPYVINMTLPDEPENYIHRIGRVGRAERMGLAISIVADDSIDEKVWYHKCANRGKNCNNRNLTDKGGCTIWYKEYEYLRAVEARLKMEIPLLSPQFELPDSIASMKVDYGEECVSAEAIQNPHLELIAPTVKELAQLEIQVQNSFLTFKYKFGNK